MEGCIEIHMHLPQEIEEIQVVHDKRYPVSHHFDQSYRPPRNFWELLWEYLKASNLTLETLGFFLHNS